jgi:hypothetical protein
MTELEVRHRLLGQIEQLNMQQLLFLEMLIPLLGVGSLKSQPGEAWAGVGNPYPLRGMPIEYLDPTEPVALEHWEILQ